MTPPNAVEALIGRLEKGVTDNALDVLIEVAIFEPSDTFSAVRANNAGPKVIYTLREGGGEETYLASDWSKADWPLRAVAMQRLQAIRAKSGGAL